jgi:tetratricopeptide (TPR) repeat protein
MDSAPHDNGSNTGHSLADQGYWPAVASRRLAEGKYSAVVELCRENLSESPELVSGLLLQAIALHRAGQQESATEQFYQVLSLDPDNIAALKYLGDIAASAGDNMTALAYYGRVLEIDPYCRGLRCALAPRATESTRTVRLVRSEEPAPANTAELRAIPFVTETMGDLYLAQGHARLAATVFGTLHEQTHHPRLLQKLRTAEERIKDREKRTNEHVTHTD